MPGSGSRSNTSASSDYSEESSDPEASAVSHPGWRAALAERRQQSGEMDDWPQPKAAAKSLGRTQRTAPPPPLPKGSSSSTDEGDSDDGENADGRETLRFGLGAPDDDDETDEMEDEERAYSGGWGRRPAAPTMTWPPAVAVNSNHPDLIGLGPEPGRKKKKPGIIYLSSIPQGFNVSRTIGFFAQYGRVGRVYLQPDLKEKAQRKDKLARNFTEGWVEFQSKRLAKEVAANLNLSQVGGKKRSKSHDVTWNIKYLTGFKWTHLSEKLAYEKAVHQQRMRNEISQAKRETDFIKTNLEKSKRLEKRKLKDEGAAAQQPMGGPSPTKRQRVKYEFRQKETDEAIRQAKKSNAAAAKSSVKKKKSSSAGKFVVTDVKKEEVEEDEDEASPPKRRRSTSGDASSSKPPPPSKKNPPGRGGKTPGKKPKSPAATNGKPAKKEATKKKKVPEGKGPKAGKAATANSSALSGGGKARNPSGGGGRKAPPPDRNELLKSLM